MSLFSLKRLIAPPPATAPRPGAIVIDGRTVTVRFRRHGAARRMILRIDRDGDGVVVTLPPRTSAAAGLEFAASQAGWIWPRLATPEAAAPRLGPGSELPLRGQVHRIEHRPGRRGPVWTEAGEPPLLCVAGAAEHLERRLTDWLKREARADLAAASARHAAAMGVRYVRLTVRDTASRWGSCSADGALSYSWRLVLAPAFVLDYVAAHEVAHLEEMNHGARFWDLVRRHCARTDEARRWLRHNGRRLHGIGL